MKHLNIHYDKDSNTVWIDLKSMNMVEGLLDDILSLPTHVADSLSFERPAFVVFTSACGEVFNLGGDLKKFSLCWKGGLWDSLQQYAHKCVNALHLIHTGFGLPLTTYVLVQGKAYGGGMEGTLSCDHIVAERSAEFRLPEVAFDLFPGMGAYTFLRQRVGGVAARGMMKSGGPWSPDEMLSRGLVDRVVSNGAGWQTITNLIKAAHTRPVSHAADLKLKRVYETVDIKELFSITDMWVDSVKRLTSRNIRLMERLVQKQEGIMK